MHLKLGLSRDAVAYPLLEVFQTQHLPLLKDENTNKKGELKNIKSSKDLERERCKPKKGYLHISEVARRSKSDRGVLSVKYSNAC